MKRLSAHHRWVWNKFSEDEQRDIVKRELLFDSEIGKLAFVGARMYTQPRASAELPLQEFDPPEDVN
jgi:hypothetical protein